jgi:hypothetical protein
MRRGLSSPKKAPIPARNGEAIASAHLQFPPPRPFRGEGFAPYERSELGAKGEGLPRRALAEPVAKPAAELAPDTDPGASPRPDALAGAARIGKGSTLSPGVAPSPSFSKLGFASPRERALSPEGARGRVPAYAIALPFRGEIPAAMPRLALQRWRAPGLRWVFGSCMDPQTAGYWIRRRRGGMRT